MPVALHYEGYVASYKSAFVWTELLQIRERMYTARAESLMLKLFITDCGINSSCRAGRCAVKASNTFGLANLVYENTLRSWWTKNYEN